jgi:hypothetical protein
MLTKDKKEARQIINGKRPSALEIEQLVKVQLNSRGSGSTSIMARLVHARLYGSDDPYISRSSDELMQEMEQIRDKYEDHDRQFLFETNCEKIQLVVYNQGQDPIVDASIALLMPKDNEFYIDRSPDEMASCPSISVRDKSIHIASQIGDIPVGQPIEVFSSALRVCIGPALNGRRFGIRYALQGRNLRSPVKGTLRLNFWK